MHPQTQTKKRGELHGISDSNSCQRIVRYMRLAHYCLCKHQNRTSNKSAVPRLPKHSQTNEATYGTKRCKYGARRNRHLVADSSCDNGHYGTNRATNCIPTTGYRFSCTRRKVKPCSLLCEQSKFNESITR